ncbi:hypothetical protein DYI95_001420 [Thermaerobacter sp. PB12/4term]|uniref:hypothetical protein n=1 Tax=Thermaerobacter sp. PB12/4term TaxID=2293838 RepID=UPI000E32C9E9|nr:hypothetical protein [Thermaerobacter sp. PB12/4term]QIA26368.1 hypothetical protein DYI95_001420 [Thermaerobacter sp. PB12/4term]
MSGSSSTAGPATSTTGAANQQGWIGTPLRPPPLPWGWAAACLAFGWGAGSLFRLRQLTGVNVLDMFGFWCLVGAGLAAARFFTLLQVADGRRRLLDAVDQLPPGILRVALPAAHRGPAGRGGAEILLVGSNRAWVLGTLDLSAAARPRSARKQLRRACDLLQAGARSLGESLAAAGLAWPESLQPVLVLTRRPAGGPVLEHGCWQLNPEHLGRLVLQSAEAQGSPHVTERLTAWYAAAAAGKPPRPEDASDAAERRGRAGTPSRS